MKTTKKWLLSAALLASCGQPDALEVQQSQRMTIKDITDAEWQALAGQKIYFGHQSVGRNIVAGVKDLLAEHPRVAATVVSDRDPESVPGPALIEGLIGKNGDPLGKTRDFAGAVRRGLATGGIALHKYCYVDVNENTDVPRLFSDYRAAMQEIRANNPDVKLVHVTMPLMVKPRLTVKDRIKVLIGRELDFDLNLKRNEFNRLLVAVYVGKQPVFDLAALESTQADGTRLYEDVNGVRVYSMAPEWSDDGGHLNETSRKMVAEQLLVFLARLHNPARVTVRS
ncbi:MAG: hypothetical protein ACREMA_10225 [Longimicrobiales bacterium]